MVHSAKVASLAARAAEFGIDTGPVRIDMRAVQRRKRRMVEDLIDVHRNRYEESGAELLLAGSVIFYWFPRSKRLRNLRDPVLIFDAAGLAVFAVGGTQKALGYGLSSESTSDQLKL